MRLIPLLTLVVLVASCGSQSQPSKPPAVHVRMDPKADLVQDFFAQPFPLETRRANGRYDLQGFPNPISNSLIETYKAMFPAGLNGYGTNAAIYFSFTGDLAFEQAVTDAVASSQGKASVLLLNIDGSSPDYGRFTPVHARFYRGASRFLPVYTLAITPVPGFPLRENTLYAALVLKSYGLRAVHGDFAQAPALREALAGRGRWGGLLAPLVVALREQGIDGSDVMAATVYQTMDVTGPIFRARDWLFSQGPTGDAQIDRINTYSVRLSTGGSATRWQAYGTFASPRLQQGQPPFMQPGEGGFAFDAQGYPVAVTVERLRFTFLVPSDAPPVSGWPLVIYAHGTGGDFTSGIYPEGYRLAEKGIVLASYDQPLHGLRHPGFADDPSGLGCVGTCPAVYTFNFLNPPAGRDGFRQSAIDATQLLRALLALRFRLSPGGPEHKFDPDRVYYMGHSQGSTSGPIFVAADDGLVKAAVFSGPAGGLAMAFLYKTKPTDIPAIARFLLDEHEGFDLFHPLLNLFQAYSEPADPMNYGRYLALETRKGAVRDVLLTEGLVDGYTPPVQAEAFALAVGVQPVAPVFSGLWRFDLTGIGVATAPFSGNRVNASGQRWTGALLQYPENGHFSIYCNRSAESAYMEFLGQKADTGLAVVVDGERYWVPSNRLGCVNE